MGVIHSKHQKKGKVTNEALDVANVAQLACDECRGWEACKDVVADGATFFCQADAIKNIKTVKEYAEWCAELAKACPDPKFDVRVKTWDKETKTAIFFCTYHMKNTAEAGKVGPKNPTGKSVDSDYVYFMKMTDDNKIERIHKVWNDGYCLEQAGWA